MRRLYTLKEACRDFTLNELAIGCEEALCNSEEINVETMKNS